MKIFGYVILVFCLVCVSRSHSVYAQGKQVVLRGQLKSAGSGEPVPYASVLIKDSGYGVTSNDRGRFELPVPERYLGDSLVISSLGYTTFKGKINELSAEDVLDIRLKEAVYNLPEITVTPLDPEALLLSAIRKVPYHFGGEEPLELEYFYRSVTKEDDHYAYFVESAFRLTAKGDRRNAMRSLKLDYRAVRRSINLKQSPLPRPFITPNVIFTWKIPLNDTDRLEKLIAEKAWVFALDYSSQDNDLIYIVKANVNPARYPGDGPIRGRDFILNYVFYIREKDFAILRIDYGAGDYSRRLQPEGVPAHLRLEANEDGILVFQALSDRSFLHYYQVVVGYTWYERETGKLIAQGVEKNEAIIQEVGGNDETMLPLIRSRNNSIPITEYDSSFWHHYALKDQIPLDPQVIKDLEHHAITIEDQFEGNSQDWWSPQTLNKIYKSFQSEPPEPSLAGNVSVQLPGFTEAKLVSVAGDFNSWNPIQYFLQKNERGWAGKLKLPPGTYSYKFVVDGRWISTAPDGGASILVVP